MYETTRRSYRLLRHKIIDDQKINEVIIDPHVDKHKDHINDEIILKLVCILANKLHAPCSEQENYKYYSSFVAYKDQIYRVVWLLEKGASYIGIITAFKDKGAKL